MFQFLYDCNSIGGKKRGRSCFCFCLGEKKECFDEQNRKANIDQYHCGKEENDEVLFAKAAIESNYLILLERLQLAKLS